MLIALNQILSSGGTKRVLLNPDVISWVKNHDDTGSIVGITLGSIHVVETPEQIKTKVEAIEILGWKDYIVATDQDNQRYEDSQLNDGK